MDHVLSFVDYLMAHSTPDAPAWNVEHKLSGKPTRWNYVDGCMIKAILDLYKATNNFAYFDFAKQYVDFFVDQDGNIPTYNPEEYNCDHINMGKVLFDLYAQTNDVKYKNAATLLYGQLAHQPRISSGNYWHKLIYPNQVWLDGLYMVQPFACAYQHQFTEHADVRDTLKQFQNVYELLRDPVTGLYYHGYDESREMFWADKTTGLSKNFWTRSIGWFAMALVDTIDIIGTDNKLPQILTELLDALLKVQDPDSKMFYQVTNMLGKEDNYLETSGTCAIAYTLMKANRLEVVPEMYYMRGKEIFDAVVHDKLVLNEHEFVLKDICLVAGLGGMPGKGSMKRRDGTYEYYLSEPRVDNDAKGVAPFLFGYAEILRRKQDRG